MTLRDSRDDKTEVAFRPRRAVATAGGSVSGARRARTVNQTRPRPTAFSATAVVRRRPNEPARRPTPRPARERRRPTRSRTRLPRQPARAARWTTARRPRRAPRTGRIVPLEGQAGQIAARLIVPPVGPGLAIVVGERHPEGDDGSAAVARLPTEDFAPYPSAAATVRRRRQAHVKSGRRR